MCQASYICDLIEFSKAVVNGGHYYSCFTHEEMGAQEVKGGIQHQWRVNGRASMGLMSCRSPCGSV